MAGIAGLMQVNIVQEVVPNALYGRELELKALRDALAEAIRSRESRAVLVLGSPGMGKRALVERFISSLPRTACWVLRAAGSWSRRSPPWLMSPGNLAVKRKSSGMISAQRCTVAAEGRA